MSFPTLLEMPLGGESSGTVSNPYDTTAFLSLVRQYARAPTSTATGWADADILRLANAELLTGLGAQVLRLRREFFVTSKDYTLTAGTASYALPPRAAFGKAREVQLIGSDGSHKNLPERTLEALDKRDTTSNNGTPSFYYWQGNNIVLVPAPDASQYPTLRVWYFRRPSRLVAVSSVLTITSVSSAPTYTGTGSPSFADNLPVDFIDSDFPFVPIVDDEDPFTTGATSVTTTAAISGVAVGDYVALAGEAPVVQLPPEFFPVLARRTANEMLRGGSDPQALAEGERALDKLEGEAFGALAADRNEGEVEAIVNGGIG